MEQQKALDTLSKALENLANFISNYHNLIDVCMVDFVTKDVFDNAVPNDLKEDLQKLNDNEICALPEKFFGTEDITISNKQPLNQLINELRQHTIESLCTVDSTNSFINKLDLYNNAHKGTSLKHFDKFMSDKKMHEVVVMSELVKYLTMESSVQTLIDLGSGKAYLSQVLSATCDNLRILAIDSSKVNSEGAKKRSDRLDTKWDALKKRADYRASGVEPPVRSKHAASKKCDKQEQKIDNESNDSVKRNRFEDTLKYVTKFVDMETDLQSLVKDSFPRDHNSVPRLDDTHLGLIGLHTCGNLAADSIKIWATNKSIKFLCNVGCCYHHIDEEFYRNPYLLNGETDKSIPSFPLSTQLKKGGYQLGRNARMVAAQPMDRLKANKQLPNESLLWRAILQHILLIHIPDLHFANQQVRNMSIFIRYFCKIYNLPNFYFNRAITIFMILLFYNCHNIYRLVGLQQNVKHS